jgi:hypothetical protein
MCSFPDVGVRVMELRGEGVTVSGTWGEGYGGQKLGVRVSGTLVEGKMSCRSQGLGLLG